MVTIQQKLESEYQITKTNDAKTDIVTAGSIVVLHKDKLLMVAATSAANPCMNTYRDGQVFPNKACKFGSQIVRIPGLGSHIPHADNAPATRNFVAGEKFWVTKIDVKDSGKGRGVVFDFFTDATPAGDQGIRYKGVLSIPFPASISNSDDALKLVAEVITVVAPEDAKKDSDTSPQPPAQSGQQVAASPNQPPPPAAPAPAEPTPAPIEPPPPPPTEVSEGQTIDQVLAALGQPVDKISAGNKVIYIYKNLKVTFVDGKVKEIQ
jgi:hypothetical protein